MLDDLQSLILSAFIELFERVRYDDRTGIYETTYWFDDGTPLQVINFNSEPLDEEDGLWVLDHSIELRHPDFRTMMIGFYSDMWNYQLEPYEHPSAFLRWARAGHVVTKVSGTD